MSAIGLDYWYSWFPLRFRKKTMRLSLAADGAYRRLIDEYMIQRAPLLDDDVVLARILGVSVDEWLAVAPFVRPYFHANGDKLVHGTCEEQIRVMDRRAQTRAGVSSKAAKQRWKEHNRIKELDAGRMLDAYAASIRHNENKELDADSNAQAMLGNATIVSKKITSSEYDAARERETIPVPRAVRPSSLQRKQEPITNEFLKTYYPKRQEA